MTSTNYANTDYDRAHLPPATPPVIAGNASSTDAATMPDVHGDSDQDGSQLARQGGGDTINPGEAPPEVAPDQGDTTYPSAPDEVVPDGGDSVNPGRTPDEAVPVQPDVLPPPD